MEPHRAGATDVLEQGSPNLGEIIRNSTYNYGVASVGNVLGAVGAGGAVPQANFRGLGEGATLTLLDGRRAGSQNLANLYPQILIDRVENLTAGGSVIYGTDAVGGVINLIPRRNFEGLEARASYNAATQGDWDEMTWSVIGGGSSDFTSFVGAFEYRDRDDLQFFDRPQYSLGGFSFSNVAWPGNFQVATRSAFFPNEADSDSPIPNVTGAISIPTSSPAAAKADPGCGANNESASKADGVLARRQGTRVVTSAFTDLCLWEFGENFDYQPEVESWTTAVIFEHQFTPHLSFNSELLFNRLVSEGRGSPSNPGGRNSELPVVPGEHPGNPFRAFLDVNNNGRYEPEAGDQLLFAQQAQDADGNLLFDEFGTPLPARGANGQVIVTGTDPNNGVPFNEDVVITNWRPVGYPFVEPTRNNPDGTGRGDGDLTTTNFRWVGGINWDIPDTRGPGSPTTRSIDWCLTVLRAGSKHVGALGGADRATARPRSGKRHHASGLV